MKKDFLINCETNTMVTIADKNVFYDNMRVQRSTNHIWLVNPEKKIYLKFPIEISKKIIVNIEY